MKDGDYKRPLRGVLPTSAHGSSGASRARGTHLSNAAQNASREIGSVKGRRSVDPATGRREYQSGMSKQDHSAQAQRRTWK